MNHLDRLQRCLQKRLLLLALTLLFASTCAYAQRVAYVRSTVGQPWGRADNEGILTRVFTNWLDLRYETVNPASLFVATNSFIFMEGSDADATAMATFLGKNLSLMSNWVNSGGSLFLNAAPNVGSNINFGFGITLAYPDYGPTVGTSNAAHAIFKGPYTPITNFFVGNYFAHGSVAGTGLSVMLTNQFGRSVLAERRQGAGNLIVGGMTLPFFHTPNPQASNLLANVFSYGFAQANTLPRFGVQPVSQTVFQGDDATFTVSATTPQGSLSYQWLFNTNPIPGETSTSLVLVAVSPGQAGKYSVTVSNDNGAVVSSNAVLTVIPTVPLPIALDAPSLSWSTSGDANWHGLTNISYDGMSAARSGPINAGKKSGLVTAVNGPGKLSFWWKVSSQTNTDLLTFYAGGVAQAVISGEVNWQQQTYWFGSGSKPLQWTYAKDPQSVGSGLDASWVDQVSYVPGTFAPVILTPPSGQNVLLGSQVTFAIAAGGTPPLRYQWSRNGQNISGATGSSYTIVQAQYSDAGSYVVTVTNSVNSTSAPPVNLIVSGLAAWGDNDFDQSTPVVGLSNLVAIAAGGYHSLALRSDGTVLAWGDDSDEQIDVPATVINAIGIAGGGYHSLAVLGNGHVIGWGANDNGQINVPPTATNVVAVSAGDAHSLALRADGTVIAWGDNSLGQTTVPAGLNNIVAIAAGGQHNLALRADGTVAAFGSDLGPGGGHGGQTDVPFGLAQVVAIAAGGAHSLALRENGSVVAWGDNSAGEVVIPSTLSKAVAIAAGGAHSLAVAEGGAVIGWGDNLYAQSIVPSNMPPVRAVAAGTYHSLAMLGRSPLGPAITTPTYSPNQFRLSFQTQTGKAYFLEYKNSLLDPTWTILSGTVGNGNVNTLTDTTATGNSRLYRVRQQ